jgi:hypothetical protein
MRSSHTRIVVLLAFAAAALLIVPVAADAATVFGSRLNHDPANSGECASLELGPCTIASDIEPSEPNGDPYSGGAPVNGVITSFRIRAKATKPTPLTFEIAEVNPVSGTNGDAAIASAVATGPAVTIAPVSDEAESVPIQQFAGRVPVRVGQHLAVDTSGEIETTYNSSGDKFSYVFAPPLGATPQGSVTATGELLVQATIEPDADNDGFGDETQDQCPTQAATQGPCIAPPAPPATVAVSGLKATAGKVSYSLSTAATVHFDLAKRTVGRKAGAKCVKVTKANRAKPHCVSFKAVGAGFAGTGAAGAQTVQVPGASKLGPGVYRVTLTATDAAGHVVTATTSLTVKAKPKPKKKTGR